jgi:SEC-C motif-containing protein
VSHLSPNAPCPCGSGIKYKKCCRPYHLGKRAPDPLTLMKSRYSAYAAGEADYILHTTHPEHPDSGTDPNLRKREILEFCRHTEFLGLEIRSYHSDRGEGWVRFVAHLSTGPMEECSRFLLSESQWLYREALPPRKCPDSSASREIE